MSRDPARLPVSSNVSSASGGAGAGGTAPSVGGGGGVLASRRQSSAAGVQIEASDWNGSYERTGRGAEKPGGGRTRPEGGAPERAPPHSHGAPGVSGSIDEPQSDSSER